MRPTNAFVKIDMVMGTMVSQVACGWMLYTMRVMLSASLAEHHPERTVGG